jgi:hypothetical protein
MHDGHPSHIVLHDLHIRRLGDVIARMLWTSLAKVDPSCIRMFSLSLQGCARDLARGIRTQLVRQREDLFP